MQEHRYASYDPSPSHKIPLLLGCFLGGLFASAAFWTFFFSLPTSCEVNNEFVQCIRISPNIQIEALVIFLAATFLSVFVMYHFRERFKIHSLISFVAGGFLGGAVIIVTAFVLFFSS